MNIATYISISFDPAKLVKQLLASKGHLPKVDVVLINPIQHKGLFDDIAEKELTSHVVHLENVIYIAGEPSESIS